eukprot:CAMPEP_0198295894 /NCGR_PEP_ID=MMETSP1449-20131203/30181_1 /TAXON_ID=420275 /ORGANISM="Attheya septentrionalis, Strain CCMP2084" /LENGTH=465 /DNA_ID=CAMNT_0043996329 /DNA_START=143 /DNA_END=1536 /DNA_ORIENTATION=+
MTDAKESAAALQEELSESSQEERDAPQYAVLQKVLAKDTTTPLLYEAVVRKLVYAPISRCINVCLLESAEEGIDDNELDAVMGQEPVYSWHYFVHYQGWNVKWDRWVSEDQLYADTEASRTLAKRLKEEAKCLNRGSSPKKTMEVMQRIVRLEQELREKQARGESIEMIIEEKGEEKKENEPKKEEKKKEIKKLEPPTGKKRVVTKAFLAREGKLRKQDLTSRKCSINLPFSLKQVLTDDWEIITQCGLLHSLPAKVSVKDALNAYYEAKMKVLNVNDASNGEEEEDKKDDDVNVPADEQACEKTAESIKNDEEWREMVDGIALFFDQALSTQLLFRHEIPQCMLLEQNHEKRYCELYPCEHLIRMCIKLPESLEDAKHIAEDEKSRIVFKVGDLLRFLNRHQDVYFLQQYRKATAEESAKAERFKKRLGLGQKEEVCEVEKTTHDNVEICKVEKKDGNKNRKRT